ncbi:MAG TPA: hypothetical protein VGN46_16740 [Luteibacter sp.]
MYLRTVVFAALGSTVFCPTAKASDVMPDTAAHTSWVAGGHNRLSISSPPVALGHQAPATPWNIRSPVFAGSDLPRTYRPEHVRSPLMTIPPRHATPATQLITNAALLILSAIGKVRGYGRDTMADIGKPPLGIRPDSYVPAVQGSIK